MFCSKCGKEIKKDTKFCSNCGEKVSEVKKEVKKVEPVKVEEPKKESSGLGIAGMIIGIISLLLSWILTLLIILVPVIGLILSCCAKGKKGFKITGIVTNALAIVACLVLFVVYLATLGSIFGTFIDENKDEIDKGLSQVKTTVKSGYPYGTWTCVSYDSVNLGSYNYDDIKSNDDKDLTVLKLNTDKTYQYGPKVDNYKNYYKGTFTYEIETDKNNESHNLTNGYKFITVKGPVSDFMIDGEKQEVTTQSLDMEMELFREYDYDKALIIFTRSYNMYMCER